MRLSTFVSLTVLLASSMAIPATAEAKSGKRVSIVSNERILTPYQRPTQTTPAQRKSVQGAPCTTCGASAPKNHADHRDPLVRQHHRGPIDANDARSVEAVQPQCPTCSARQGGQLRAERQRLQSDARRSEDRVNRGCPGLTWIKNGGKC